MKNKYSQRLANRIEKARQLDAHIAGCSMLLKNQMDAVNDMRMQLELCETLLLDYTTKEKLKLAETLERYTLYNRAEDGMLKRLTLIYRHIIANKNVDETTKKLVMRYMRIIRGHNNSKSNVTLSTAQAPTMVQTVTAADLEKDPVQHTGGYGAKIGYFYRLLAVLEHLGDVYTPGNKLAKLDALKKLYTKLEKMNRSVVVTKDAYDHLQRSTKRNGKLLMAYCYSIKNHLAAEYGYHAPEHAQVRSVPYI